ncbi:MAG: PhzF family phenazine biosynthesis protein [Bacteroidota bacterium]
MELPIYQVDAFTGNLFSGNPAAVCPLVQWLPDTVMQQIAMENNLAETAFVVPEDDGYAIRWFTPIVEVDLCGHATLASAWVLFNKTGYSGTTIKFRSLRSGILTVTRSGELLTLDFPSDPVTEVVIDEQLTGCFQFEPVRIYRGKSDFLFEFNSESEIKLLKPVLARIAALQTRGVIATAPGDTVDMVSRFFGPACGVDEDPVTGSAHTTLTPFWASRLEKNNLVANQLSARGGELFCTYRGDRTEISGKAVLYMQGILYL